MRSFKKDPNAELDYTFDWAPWLTPISDTIASVSWILNDGTVIVGGIALESQANTATTATAVISGGVVDTTELLTCRITTTGGRIDDRSIELRILNR